MLVEVGDGERHLGFLAAGHRVVLPDADQVVAGLGDERDVCPHGLHRRGRQLLSRDEPSQPEEPVVGRRVTQLVVELAQGADVGWSSGTDPDGPARGQQHVPFERRQLLFVLRPHAGHCRTLTLMRASERQRASGQQRPAWPGNAMTAPSRGRNAGEPVVGDRVTEAVPGHR